MATNASESNQTSTGKHNDLCYRYAIRYGITSMFLQLLLQQGHQQNVVRSPVLTTVKGNIVQQIPVQQQQLQQQAGQQTQQQQGQQNVMHSPSQQLINAAILPNASGGGSVTVWQRRPDQSKYSFEILLIEVYVDD